MTTIPAAQYLRMSTEHQQYSAENQSLVISQYATNQGFSIVRTYSDPARSGLWLKNRAGLRELLRDVATGEVSYRAILVYDVSRWGRFQDTDESAHYEFLCKSAGIPVHYCAEPFPNDGSMFSLITKNLKRLMAAEYSRELGTKVLAGQKRLAQLGFKQGGSPGYGFRRLLLSSDRKPKQALASGERKSIATDRVVLIPGPANEVEVVRKIFRMFAIERRSIRAIVKDLNSTGIPFQNNRPWRHHVLSRMLSHPKYIGCNVFNRETMRLGSHRLTHTKADWVLVPDAHQGIVDPAVFAKTQNILENLTIRKADEVILESLRSVLCSEGRLSAKIIEAAPGMVSLSTLANRFGGLRQTYRLLGYDPLRQTPVRCSARLLREQLLSELEAMFPDELSVVSGGKWRSWLKLRDGLIVRVFVARMATSKSWRVDASKLEQQSITLLARVNAQATGFRDFYILPKIEKKHLWVQVNDSRLEEGIRLSDLSQLCKSVLLLARNRNIEASA
jgi:DNA invertase Pin-like site-specific DNA recombinase